MPASETAMLVAIVKEDGSAAIAAGADRTEFDTSSVEDGRHAIMMHAIAAAQERGEAVRLRVTEPDGSWPLIVHADGNVEPDEDARLTPLAVPDTVQEAAEDAAEEAVDDAAEGSADSEDPSAAEAAPSPDPAPPRPGTPLATLADIAYDDADDDSDVVDDPSPEPPTRRRQRESTDTRPVGAAPQPMSAAFTPKATASVDPVTAPATPSSPPSAAAPSAPAPARSAGPESVRSAPSDPARSAQPAPTTAASPGTDPIDVFASLQAPGESSDLRATRTEAPVRQRGEGDGRRRSERPVRTRRESPPDGRRSFLTPEHAEEPAERGWRGFLVRAGVRVPPSAEERAERADMSTVSQHWPGPRTIAIVNAKGGSGKTPTTILTSAVFARYGGAGVLAWDNNQTRGTLGWRTEQGPHDASLHDLLPETDRLLSAQAQSADLAHFVHHQTRDRYDVLRSRPMLLADEQRIKKEDIDRIHSVAAKYYRLIVMDSGNDESDPMWRRMIDLADQIVIATTTRAEHAEAGALLLEALTDRDERSARLVRQSVAVVSQADPHASAAEVQSVVDGYRALSREVAAIPYDPAMAGGYLHFSALRPATQRAWLAATAAIARGLGPQPT
ncbi:MinD/ParA family ATP-binding protein [Microbacterium sp. JZ31]|uniref:MinD/ParA family ATP-binding protein n=1 Tax=Microbacterium sp. JZ31 TaxID=1906274 RepID=UPI001EE4C8D4|nr:AAA family ATPase [Microbacterium sp. JZ31]